MAIKPGQRTANGKCLKCGAVIAWHKGADQIHHLYNPVLRPDGTPARVLVPNGGTPPRMVRRTVPSLTSPHRCESPLPASAPAPAGQTVPDATDETGSDPLDTDLVAPVQAVLPAAVPSLDMDAVDARIRATCKAIIEGIVPPPPKRIIIRIEQAGGSAELDVSEQHSMMAELVPLVAARSHNYLFGPAGSGKSKGQEIALGLCGFTRFEMMSMPGTLPGGIKGYDGPAKFVHTVVSRAFGNKDKGERGWPIIMDEFDRMLPECAAALNTILESRRMVVDGETINAGEDFFVLGNGNTDMRGATDMYTAARPLDYSTAARFPFIFWDYDLALEDRLVGAILPDGAHIPLVAWRRTVHASLTRDRAKKVLCGPREAIRIAEALMRGTSIQSAVAMWVWRGLDADQVKRYEREHPLPVVKVKR